MSYYSNAYEQERQQRRTEWEQAPKRCPHCRAPINQQPYSDYSNDKPQNHCGATACRSAAYRLRKAQKLQEARQEAKERIDGYAAAHLQAEQATAVRAMRDTLMSTDPKAGHELALSILAVIEGQSCKHDKIAILLDNASAAKRRAEKAEEHNRELQAVYERRIAELQAELQVYQLLESSIHNIATRQLAQQPDPQAATPAPEDEDLAAVLTQAGIKPVGQMLAERSQEGDDPENQGDEEDYEDDDPEL